MANLLFIAGLEIDFYNPRSVILFVCILQGAIFAALLFARYFKQWKLADFWLTALPGNLQQRLQLSLQNGLSANLFKKSENGFYKILPNENMEIFPKVTPYENNFCGQAFIIAGSAASASFQFLDYVRENKLAKIVGQTSGGNKQGINGGNYFFLNLPNSKAEIDVPVYFQTPLTAQKDSGVVPEIPVQRKTTDIGNNIDREMIAIKRLINRKQIRSE